MIRIIEPFSFVLPITVEFGRGVSKKAGNVARNCGWKKACVVTDKGVIKAGLVEGVIKSLEAAHIEYTIFDEVKPNPTDKMTENAALHIKKERCDFTITVGGGSPMDVGKVASLLATNPGKITDYELRGVEDLFKNKIRNNPLPLIAIPTTAGTGSEVDFWAVITDTKRKFKMALGQPPFRPGRPYLGARVALVDPLLTLSLPSSQTATVGIDAFFHAVETYIAKGTVPIVTPLALYAIRLISKYLLQAYADGSHIEARENMMLAAHIGGICLSYGGLTAIHSLAEAVGGIYEGVPHGTAVAIFARHILEYNRIVIAEKLCEIVNAMGENLQGLSVQTASKKAIEVIFNFIKDLNLATNFKRIGVKKEDFPEIAKRAMQAIEMPGNPRKMTYNDILKIIEKAYEE